ncbi:branched-chain amino acid ABC transporter permease [Azohydromonas aeria]|uniref:branched-chain amino acid ABC transporter permease n=1 Tax=Azohydromonas aeria TaxID=2590212 RepID=UPI0012FA0B32
MTSPYTWLGCAAATLALLLAPTALYPVFLMKALCFALFACSFNLLLGFAGLVSFGHAAFFAAAAYTTAHLAKAYAIAMPLAVGAGVLVAAAMGWAMGSLAIRRQGIYFSMITLALAQLVYFYFVQAPWTGAEDGIQGVPRGTLFGLVALDDNLSMYYVVAAVAAAGFWFIHRIVHSPFGEVLKAIRENEPRAVSLGYDVDRYKLLAFVLSAALAGLAGSIKVLALQVASLQDAHWHMSGEVMLMTLLGGLGTIVGPVVGAFFVTGLGHYLTDVGSWIVAITGAIFIAVVMLFRKGIVGELNEFLRRKRMRALLITTVQGKETAQ